MRCSIGSGARRPTIAAAHPGEQVLFRVACSLVCVGKTEEQTVQVFHHGYARLEFRCIPSDLERKPWASFNHEAMSEGDAMRPVIS